MGIFDKLFEKKTQPVFEKIKEEVFVLENQNCRLENPTKNNLNDFLNCLFSEDDQFITLTLPKAKNGIRYVQACYAGDKLIVQLGLESINETHLVEKTCSSNQECIDIFYQVFDNRTVNGMKKYKSVKF